MISALGILQIVFSLGHIMVSLLHQEILKQYMRCFVVNSETVYEICCSPLSIIES
jgi:hypothetical protein